MLSGAEVTEEARAAAKRLIEAAAVNAHIHTGSELIGLEQKCQGHTGRLHVFFQVHLSSHQRQSLVGPTKGMCFPLVPVLEEGLHLLNQIAERGETPVSEDAPAQDRKP